MPFVALRNTRLSWTPRTKKGKKNDQKFNFDFEIRFFYSRYTRFEQTGRNARISKYNGQTKSDINRTNYDNLIRSTKEEPNTNYQQADVQDGNVQRADLEQALNDDNSNNNVQGVYNYKPILCILFSKISRL